MSEREKTKRRTGTIEPLNNGSIEKSKRDSGTFAKAWEAFANLESFCKSPAAGIVLCNLLSDVILNPKVGASCQLFLSLQSAGKMQKMQMIHF